MAKISHLIHFDAGHDNSGGGDPGGRAAAAGENTGLALMTAVPAYDSGWTSLGIRPDPIAVSFTHHLGGNIDTYLVELTCRDNTSLTVYDCTDQNFVVNAHWYGLTKTTVTVYASGGSRPDHVRVRIFTEAPAYDSGWDALLIRPDPIPVLFTHNLGGDIDDYLVSLTCRDDTTLGHYDCRDQNFNTNAHWYGLSNSSATAWVAGGSRPDEVRLRIYIHPPTYDSGWVPLLIRPDPIPVPFAHNLGGDRQDYQVKLTCRDDTSLGTYDCTDQNFGIDAHWYGLSNSSATAWVLGGSRPDDVRLRIWHTNHVYLPALILGDASP